MKMDSFAPQGAPSRANGSALNGVNGHHRPKDVQRFSESAHFANIMVEFETDNREMAVDVPDSFIATAKTPPRYPPPNSNNSSLNSHYKGHGHNHSLLGSFHTSSEKGTPPPTLNRRSHLRIEDDGHLLNTQQGPPIPKPPNSAGSSGSGSSGSSGASSGSTQPQGPTWIQPTEQQSQRMKKYYDEINKRDREMESRAKSNDLLRQSIRNSQKMIALKHSESPRPMNGYSNKAFHPETSSVPSVDPLALAQAVKRLRGLGGPLAQAAESVANVVGSSEFKNAVALQNKLKRCQKGEGPATIEATDNAAEISDVLARQPEINSENTSEAAAARELSALLSSPGLEGLLYAHDKLGMRHMAAAAVAEDAFMDRLSHYSEPNIKIVRIEKTNEPLGATVKNEEDAVVVGRIIRGGTAEASGLLHEGDEILEVNEVPLRGKNVNEVCDILAAMQGTLTLLVVPTRQHMSSSGGMTLNDSVSTSGVMHVKAHIDYDPEDDPYVPCRELGISFLKGDILHVINQKDPNWWQARREGEDDQQLPGLIPSASFQQQREAVKHTIAQDAEKNGLGRDKRNTGFLCAKRRSGKKKRRVPYLPDEEDGEEVIAYEEVTLYYPRSDRKRPVVLIGPPNIGRHELRQRLMQDGDRFSAAIPHTSRPKRLDEIDGQDYHFISRPSFEQDILSRKFVEHGEYEKSYYGTSLEAIRTVVFSERICVLNLHPQSLRILKTSDLMPFVVFVAPPSLEKLKRWKMERAEPANDEELKDIIERAREMEEAYGHFFDMVIIYSDPERAYGELLREINLIEREPQWIPGAWVNKIKNSAY